MSTPTQEQTPSFDPLELAKDPFLQSLEEIFADFFEGFGFKANVGRIWTVLFYSPEPLTQKELVQIVGLSTGMVSQSLNELIKYEMVHAIQIPNRREQKYDSEKNLIKVASSILQRREKKVIARLRERIEELKEQLSISKREPDWVRARIHAFEEVLALCELAEGVIGLIGRFSRYSYHAIAVGVQAMRRLKISELPRILGTSENSIK